MGALRGKGLTFGILNGLYLVSAVFVGFCGCYVWFYSHQNLPLAEIERLRSQARVGDEKGLFGLYYDYLLQWYMFLELAVAASGIQLLTCLLGGSVACCSNKASCSLKLFAALAVVGLVVEVFAASWGLQFYLFGRKTLVKELADGFMNYQQENSTSYTSTENLHATSHMWNMYQIKFECCGVSGPASYNMSKFYNSSGKKFPWTCCRQFPDNQTECTLGQNETIAHPYLYTQGCVDKLMSWYTPRALTVIIGAFTTVLLQMLFGLVLACSPPTKRKRANVSPINKRNAYYIEEGATDL